jgi:hypothetical protein
MRLISVIALYSLPSITSSRTTDDIRTRKRKVMVSRTESRAASADTTPARGLVNAARSAAALAVLTILWQGATAGQMLTHSRSFIRLHEVGAIGVHLFTGLAALTVFLWWRTSRDRLWPTLVAVVVFAASFVQAALGDDDSMWAHVPGALLLMLGSAAVLVWTFRPGRPAGA